MSANRTPGTMLNEKRLEPFLLVVFYAHHANELMKIICDILKATVIVSRGTFTPKKIQKRKSDKHDKCY